MIAMAGRPRERRGVPIRGCLRIYGRDGRPVNRARRGPGRAPASALDLRGVAALLFGGLCLDLLFAVVQAHSASAEATAPVYLRFHTEYGISAALLFIFVFPFYGFFSARIFPAINEQSILPMCILLIYAFYWRQDTIAALYRDTGSWSRETGWTTVLSAIVWLYLAAGALGLVAYFAGFRSPAFRIVMYGWHLGALVALCFLEWPVIVELFTARDPGAASDGARTLWIFFAAAASVVFAFYLWFALKYFFIAVSCLRARGRKLALSFFEAKWNLHRAPAGIFLGLACLQLAICIANAIFNWWPHDALIQALLVCGPLSALLGAGDASRKLSGGAMVAVFALLLFSPTEFVHAESPGSYSQRSDFVFRPLPDRDGYTQAYSVNFRGDGFRIYTVFLVSNIGPKSLNNGVAVLIYRDGESAVFTSEQDYRTLKARPGELDLHSGPHRLQLTGGGPPFNAGSRLRLTVSSQKFRLSLELSGLQRGVRLSGGPVAVSDDREDFVRADIPIAFAKARGKMLFRGAEYELDGVGGMDTIYTNRSPHEYAQRFTLSRSYDREQGFFLGVIQGDSGFPGGYQARFAWLEGGQVRSCGRIEDIEVLASVRDPLSGYRLPTRTRYRARTDNGRDCRIVESFERPAGGYSVLDSISSFLRWILRVFFARPYIVHYDTSIVFACRPAPDQDYVEEARFSGVQKSHYLINE